MAEITTQGQDRVAAVVARVERMAGPRGTYPKRVLPYLVEALDAAGLLLTEERRKRLRDHLSVLRPVLLEARLPKTCEMHDALLRELAGDGGAPASEPVCSGCGAWAKDCFCTPTPAPRRMAGNPAKWADRLHRAEHDENALCADDPPCQPVAAVGEPDMRHKLTEEQIAQRLAVDHLLRPHGRCTCAGEGRCAWCQQYEDTRAEPAHEHRWAAVAWVTERGTAHRTRVTREHCTRGDCNETREVGHG